jgi:hypothetical protein
MTPVGVRDVIVRIQCGTDPNCYGFLPLIEVSCTRDPVL